MTYGPKTPTKITIEVEQFRDDKFVYNEKTRRGRSVQATSVQRGRFLANERSAPDAKRAFSTFVEQLLDEWCEPKVLVFKGYTLLCWQDIGSGFSAIQYAYKLVKPDGTIGGLQNGYDTMDAAEHTGRLHLTQYATNYHDDQSVMDSWHFLFADQRRGHLGYAAFQRARVHIDTVEDFAGDKHTWAGTHEHEWMPALLALVPKEAA